MVIFLQIAFMHFPLGFYGEFPVTFRFDTS